MSLNKTLPSLTRNYAVLAVEERRKETLYLTTHLTHFKIPSDNEREPWLLLRGQLFLISSKGSLKAPYRKQNRTHYGICYTSCGALVWYEK